MNAKQTPDALDALIERELGVVRAEDDILARRILSALAAKPLPPQRPAGWPRWWPAELLDLDLRPAWPRVAALAGAGAVGVALGLFGADLSAFERQAAASNSSNLALVFDPEPLTGVRP